MHIIYKGTRGAGSHSVILTKQHMKEDFTWSEPTWEKLPLRLDLWNHSPTGFEWGYSGSGPAQLALAILAHATGEPELAVILHQKFKFEIVASFNAEAWTIDRNSVLEWVARSCAQRWIHDMENGGPATVDLSEDSPANPFRTEA